jgi:NTP pyrophosphatase (non-canonical NTP hydrolase)
MTDGTAGETSFAEARDRALEVRALYETLEQRFTGTTWSIQELMLGFSNDVGYIGRLILADGGVWPIEGDATAELQHKLAESLWWTFVLADKLGVDLADAYPRTMNGIRSGLEASIERTAPAAQ